MHHRTHPHAMLGIVAVVLFAQCPVVLAAPRTSCAASDKQLQALRYMICASLVGHETPWCISPSNVTAHEDWPNQAVYMRELLYALAATPPPCLATPYAVDTAHWLNTNQSDVTLGASFMQTWRGFQFQYYDMPRKAGDRIEVSVLLRGVVLRCCCWLALVGFCGYPPSPPPLPHARSLPTLTLTLTLPLGHAL
jgi:hypothetical protein